MTNVFEIKDNEAYCFSKEGFGGYSGVIRLEDGSEYWVNVYDNEGKKGPYRAVKLKKKVTKLDTMREERNNQNTMVASTASFDEDLDDSPF